MKILRFDHMHVNPDDFDAFNKKFAEFMGQDFFMQMPMQQYGTDVAYEPAPIGLESFRVTDPEKSVSAEVASKERGIFCVCYKVDDIQDAIKVMEKKGWKMLDWIDNNPIFEALFDTKDDFGFYIELTQYPFESMREAAAAAQG